MSYLKRRIFVLEGDKDTSALVKVFLESEGYQVTIAKTLDSISDSAALYIINEEGLGRRSIELCKRIRATDSATPILICSGSDKESDIEEVLRAGATDYISHPQDWIKLIGRISSLACFYLQADQNVAALVEAGN